MLQSCNWGCYKIPLRGILMVSLFGLLFVTACNGPASSAGKTDTEYADMRLTLLAEIAETARLTRMYTGREEFSARTMAALEKVPRHEFVPEALRGQAYANRPLPIGEGQTISQPYIVALMTDLLELEAPHKVLEVGTGSGYQAAILAELAGEVYSIEIVPPLGERARATLQAQGYRNIQVRIGDGYLGWPEQAPFDAVIVTAAAPEIPPPLLEQLKNGGRLVIPVGEQYQTQHLWLVEKDAQGEITKTDVLPVAFVPLTGDHGEKD